MPRPPLVLLSVVFLGLAASGCDGADEHPGTDAPAVIDAASTVDAPGEQLCGGFAGAVCDADEYCDFAANTCGATDEQGVCKPRPVGCPDVLVFMANCACDGMVYGSECDVYAAGSDRNALGSCTLPAGTFACGYTQCNVFTQYCRRDVSDVVGVPDDYSCLPVPSCPSQFPTCGCLAAEPCGSMCTGDGATGLTLTCPGG